MELNSTGTRYGKPFQANNLFSTNLRTIQEALPQQVSKRLNIEGWHWGYDTQLHKDVLCYRGNGAAEALTTLRTAALNLLRMSSFQLNRAGRHAVCHVITTLLAMARRQPS